MASLISSISKPVVVVGLGALASRGCMWLSETVQQRNGWSIGGLMHSVTPRVVTDILKAAAKCINFPVTFTAKKMKDRYVNQPYDQRRIDRWEQTRRSKNLGQFLKVVLAPLGEELLFRGLVQTLGGMALERMGVPSILAQGSSILVANTLFALAHLENNEGFNTAKFSSLFAGGLVDSTMCKQFGLPASIAEHAISNLCEDYF